MSDLQDTLREIKSRITEKMNAHAKKSTTASCPANGLGASTKAVAYANAESIVSEYIEDDAHADE